MMKYFSRNSGWGQTKPPVGSQVAWGDPISRGLVGCWLMNEGAGLKIKDIARRNDGTLTNFAVPMTSTSGWVPGNSAVVSVDGSNDCITVPFGRAVTGLTVSLWACFLAANANSTLVCGQTSSILLIDYGGGVFPRFLTNNSGAVGSITPVLGKWYHIVGVNQNVKVGGSASTVYLNGVLAGSGTQSGVTPDFTAISFGARNAAANPFNRGLLSNILVYERPLILSEIQRLYVEPFAGIAVPRRKSFSGVTVAAATSGLLMKRRRMTAA